MNTIRLILSTFLTVTTAQRQQWQEFVAAYPSHILFLRCRYYYLLLGEHAETGHQLAGLTLHTIEGQFTATFSLHRLSRMLTVFVKAGHQVAVCDPVRGADYDLFT